MIVLEIESSSSQDRRVEIDAPRTTIGRSSRADLWLDDNFASRIHSELWFDDGSYWVSDLGSINGTFHNGEAVTGPTRLEHGDAVRIGESVLTVTGLLDKSQGSTGTLVLDRSAIRAAAARVDPPSSDDLQLLARDDLLPAISRFGGALLSPASPDKVLHEVLGLVFDLLPADRAYVHLVDANDAQPAVRAARQRDSRPLPPYSESSRSDLQAQVIERGLSLITSFQDLDPVRVGKSAVVLGRRSVMAVPLVTATGIRGMIEADAPEATTRFENTDLELLKAIAGIAAVKMENSLLVEQRVEAERLQQQLESAREIQARLLPHEPPRLAGYDVRGLSMPSHAVGGDYFDFELWTDTRLGVVLGDVSGKGLDAALLISSVHAMVRAQATVTKTLGALIGRVNSYLCEFTPTSKFATVFCGVLDSDTHRLHYINAGHNPPLVVRADGTIEQLPATSVPLGLMPETRFASASVELSPESVVVIYSDGLTEATNLAGEEFGEDRLAAVIREHRGLTTARLRDRIDAALSRFSEGEPTADDLTIVLIKRDA